MRDAVLESEALSWWVLCGSGPPSEFNGADREETGLINNHLPA